MKTKTHFSFEGSFRRTSGAIHSDLTQKNMQSDKNEERVSSKLMQVVLSTETTGIYIYIYIDQ
jgi:hypothetical protein